MKWLCADPFAFEANLGFLITTIFIDEFTILLFDF